MTQPATYINKFINVTFVTLPYFAARRSFGSPGPKNRVFLRVLPE